MLIHLEKLGKTFGEKVVLHDVTASVEREDRIGIVGQNGAGKTTLLKILTGEYQDYEGEFSVTHGVTLGYLEQNAKLDATLDIYGEMRATFAPVLDAMAQMQILERRMAAQPDNADLLAQHDALQNIVAGKVEGNTVFTYLDAFSRPEHFQRYLPDYASLDELKAHYRRGGLGDVKVKKFLIAVLNETLEPIRERRKQYEGRIEEVYEILRKGSEHARATAAQTLGEVRHAMRIDYFDDKELIAEQARQYQQQR